MHAYDKWRLFSQWEPSEVKKRGTMSRNKSFLVRTLITWCMFIASAWECGCGRPQVLDPEFKRSVVHFREWMKTPGSKRNAFLADLEKQYNGKFSGRADLLLETTNMLANVVLFTSEGQSKWPCPRGLYSSPYNQPIDSYLHLVGEICQLIRGHQESEVFYLKLEVWKRLKKELDRCDSEIDRWVALCDDEVQGKMLGERFKADSRVYIQRRMECVERDMEGLFRKESEESRKAFELFRQAIGREAHPQYR